MTLACTVPVFALDRVNRAMVAGSVMQGRILAKMVGCSMVGCSCVLICCGGKIEPEPLADVFSGGAESRPSPQYSGAGGTVASSPPRTIPVASGGSAHADCNSELEQQYGSLCVAKSVPIHTDAFEFAIDATEVTRSQYAAWLLTLPDVASQNSASCAGNSTFLPRLSCMQKPTVCQGSTCGNHPQVCIDWCDARAYCMAVGKRLCGRIGGGPNAFDDFADASASQWYAVCSSGDINAFPYPGPFQERACNGYDYWGKGIPYGTLPVASLRECQPEGNYAGVFDLSGNVYEWEDSCATTAASSSCRLRGGAFHKGSDCMGCSGDGEDFRSESFVLVGFRCCGP